VPTRSITSNPFKPHTHASLTHCHPEQVTASSSKCYFETTLRPTIFDHDFLDLQDVINKQLDLFDALAATTAVNNSQSTPDDDLPHRLNNVSRLQPDLPVYCLQERRVCRSIDDFYDLTDRQLNVVTTQNKRQSLRQQTGHPISRNDQYPSLPRGYVSAVRCTQNCMAIQEHDEVGTGPDNVVLITEDYYTERCIRQSATATSLCTSDDITTVSTSDRAGIHLLLWTVAFADVLLHVLEQVMCLQTDPPLHCLLERQAYRNTVDTRQINHETSDEPTALTNIQLARQLANYLPMRG
jgi:hypothetical protein